MDYFEQKMEFSYVWINDYNLFKKEDINFSSRFFIEDMHAGKYGYDEYSGIPENTPLEVISQLSNKDMMALNKYMMDRVGYILQLIQNAEYTKLHYILDQEKYNGSDWDRPDIEKIEKDTEDLMLIEFSRHKDINN
ncbi:hypothetical protein A9986_09750 [Solibacillus silvestris]|nr:hypothetical protein [Solibacillus silvestris]OBW57022.1 hypothetical protein A9986_09750 [Solibacillus silvestris]